MNFTFRTLRSAAVVFVTVAAGGACASDTTAPNSPVVSNSSSLDSASGRSGNDGKTGSAARIRLIVRLAPSASSSFRRASGKAKWDSRDGNAKRELEIEVEDVTPGTQVEFFVDGVRYGSTVTVDALGNARVELSTQLGERVPLAAAGATAEVRTAAGGVVVSGVFPTS